MGMMLFHQAGSEPISTSSKDLVALDLHMTYEI